MNNNFWTNKNVLVTGGTGLVGSHIVEKLLEAKANVFVPYRSVNPKSYFITSGFNKKCVMAVCDLKDYQRVFDVVSRYEIDYIFHLAAQPIVPTAFINPYETLQTNITGTINVLEAGRHCPQVKGIVVASSDKAYGKSVFLPYREDSHPLKGDHPYDVSKSCADLIANMYYQTYGLPVTITRFGNIYGAGDLNFNRIIPGAILAAIKNELLQVRSDGQMVREYVYVKDVAAGYLLLGENISKAKGEAFNFGSGEKFTVLEIVKKVGEVFGKEIPVKILNEAKNEIPEQYLSYEKINKMLGWQPQYRLESALGETIAWYRQVFGDGALINNYKNMDNFKPEKMILTAGPSITEKEVNYVTDAVKNGWNEHWNDYLIRFTEAVKNYLGVKYALPTSSGTGAIFLALKGAGVGPGDEVIISDFSFAAAAYAIVHCGARPVFADALKDSWGIDPSKIEAAITPNTKAIMPVHMYSSPCEMEKIMPLAAKHGLKVIADAAPAFGAECQERKIGSIEDVAAFSFQGAKSVVTGEGGMLVTNDEQIYERAAYFNNFCRAEGENFWFTDIGYKFKMANLLAALGLAQVERIEEMLLAKKKIFNWYYERLKDIEGISMNASRPGDRNGYWMSSVVLDKNFGVSRDEVQKKLKDNLIDTRPFFYPLSMYPMFRPADTPVAHHLGNNGINLPSGACLNEETVDYVCQTLRKILGV